MRKKNKINETDIILGLIIVASFATGIFVGSVHFDTMYNDPKYHPKFSSNYNGPITASAEVPDTVDTNIVHVTSQNGKVHIHNWSMTVGYNDVVKLDFNGHAFNQTHHVVGYQCSMDGEHYYSCTSPVTESNSRDHNYEFSVRAIDENGNKDPTPAMWIWKVRNIHNDSATMDMSGQ